MNGYLDWRDFTGESPEKFHKSTLWQGEYLTLGINCLEPGQTQKAHAHSGSDKFYFVLEGRGLFILGEEEREVGSGSIVVAPAGIVHGMSNNGDSRLSVLVGISPPIKSKDPVTETK